MFNARITKEGNIFAEYPSIPSKVDETDVVLLDIDNDELKGAIFDPYSWVKITNIDPLEFEIIPREIEEEEVIEPSEIEILQQKVMELQEIVDAMLGVTE